MRLTPQDSFRSGTQLLRQGKTEQAVLDLEFAAEQGILGAIWKLGRMYADGDGVKQKARPSHWGHEPAPKLRALAVTMATRSEALADLPTVGDFVPGYEASGWFGVGAPRNTPSEIIDKLNKEINAAL